MKILLLLLTTVLVPNASAFVVGLNAGRQTVLRGSLRQLRLDDLS